MPTREINLHAGCIYHCRIVEGYDAWMAIGRAFKTYDVADMQGDAYHVFTKAMAHPRPTLPQATIARVTATYECMNVLIEALYFMAKDHGVAIKDPPPEANYPTNWAYKTSPEAMVAYFCRLGQPHQAREDLFILYQEAAVSMWRYLSKAKRKRLIKLFENLTDLATAAYALAAQGLKTKSPA